MERRSHPRFPTAALSVRIRPRGQFNQFVAEVLDFNRHGLAARLDRPLAKDQLVFLTLDDGEIIIERVIGVVHNCLNQDTGYRCGIRFRTQSSMQFDRGLVEACLARLEARLAGLREAASGLSHQ
jgi:hypothetical protein